MRTSDSFLAALAGGVLAIALAAAPAWPNGRTPPPTCQAAFPTLPGASDSVLAPPGVDPEIDPPGSGKSTNILPSTPSPRLVEQTPPLAAITASAWSSDSQRIAGGAVNGQVVVWNTDGEVIDRILLPLPNAADQVVVDTLVLGPSRSMAQTWIVADQSGDLVCGVEYRWRPGISEAPIVRLVAPPAAVVAMAAADRLALWRKPGVRNLAPVVSPDGRWTASMEPAGLLSTAGLSLRRVADPAVAIYLGRLALAAEIYGHEPELFSAMAGQAKNGRIVAKRVGDLQGALSPDRRRAAWIESKVTTDARGATVVGYVLLTFDFHAAGYQTPIEVGGLNQAAWLDHTRVLVTDRVRAAKPMVVDISTGAQRPAVAADCRDRGKGNAGQVWSGLADLCEAATERAWSIADGKVIVTGAAHESAIVFSTPSQFAPGGREELFRLHELPGRQLYLASAPDGRYESNLAWDTPLFEWVMPDEPDQALPAQMLIRDYFQPGLTFRLAQCAGASQAACASSVAPSVNVAKINHQLPEVRITDVQPIGDGRSAMVTTQTSKADAFDLRLFRDGELVEEAPDPSRVLEAASSPTTQKLSGKELPAPRRARGTIDERTSSRAPVASVSPGSAGTEKRTWWELNALATDASHVATQVFTVPLPSGPAGRTEFSAYAFNISQVISDIHRVAFSRPNTEPRVPKAFVLSIGIDDYVNPDWRLHFAAADADKMAESLQHASTDQFDIRPMVLKAQGNDSQATKKLIHDALILLSREKTSAGAQDHDATTDDPAHALVMQDFRALREPPRGSNLFTRATPDDILIVTFSGHGWTSREGEFYLIPADAKVGADGRPDVDTLISATELTEWLRQVDAGEIALVIDACHSAASIQTADFKPAPLGNKGLGQLAFDKGIRVLAASQADAVAMEDDKLGHGLLTYALTVEALDGLGGEDASVTALKSTVFKSGAVTLDAWLKYGERRLPSLSQDVAVRRMTPSDGGDIVFNSPANIDAAVAPAQAPQLFDFTSRTSRVTLRGPTGGTRKAIP